MMAAERRSTPRIAEHLPLAITEAGQESSAEVQNLSASGAYCTLDRFIAPMTKLELMFELPNGARRSRIRCHGVVVRVEPIVTNVMQGRYRVAIFFSDLAERDRETITQFVTRRLASQVPR